jgi:hypothetical protein
MNLAIFRRDVPVLQGTVVVLASLFVLINLPRRASSGTANFVDARRGQPAR